MRYLFRRWGAGLGLLVQHSALALTRLLFQPPSIDGVRIAILSRDSSETRTQRVREAMHIIAKYSPHRYQQLTRSLRWIIVVPRAAFQYHPGIRACSIEADWLDRAGSIDTACVVIHEATHARLWLCGVRYEGQARERVERLCLRAEAELLKRLGMPDEARQTMERLQEKWWEN